MKDMVLNFLLRIIFGVLGIYACNNLLSGFGVEFYAGINALNLLTIGTLGISGFGLVFAIAAFSVLWKMPNFFVENFCELFRLVSKKRVMLKSIQDKRLSGVSDRKPYHDGFGQVTHCEKHKNVCLWFFSLRISLCSILKNWYIFQCIKIPSELHGRRFL